MFSFLNTASAQTREKLAGGHHGVPPLAQEAMTSPRTPSFLRTQHLPTHYRLSHAARTSRTGTCANKTHLRAARPRAAGIPRWGRGSTCH